MYQGKYNRSEKNGRFAQRRTHGRRRSLLVLVSVFVLTFAMVGGTFAYLATNTQPVKNTFEFGKTDVTIPENFDKDKGIKKDVTVKNEGNIPVYIRAQIVVTWKDASGKVSSKVPVKGTDYTMTGPAADWVKYGDFYYYTARVPAGDSTSKLINKATEKAGRAPEGYGLSIEILAQTIQADGKAANGNPMVTEYWGVTVNSDGTLGVK